MAAASAVITFRSSHTELAALADSGLADGLV
jgi:hypothetical protein